MTLLELAEVLSTPLEGSVVDLFRKYMLDNYGIDIDKAIKGIQAFFEYVDKK